MQISVIELSSETNDLGKKEFALPEQTAQGSRTGQPQTL